MSLQDSFSKWHEFKLTTTAAVFEETTNFFFLQLPVKSHFKTQHEYIITRPNALWVILGISNCQMCLRSRKRLLKILDSEETKPTSPSYSLRFLSLWCTFHIPLTASLWLNNNSHYLMCPIYYGTNITRSSHVVSNITFPAFYIFYSSFPFALYLKRISTWINKWQESMPTM